MKRLLILVVALSLSTGVMAQQRGESNFYWSAASKASVVLSSNVDKQFTMGESEIAYGYNFNDSVAECRKKQVCRAESQ